MEGPLGGEAGRGVAVGPRGNVVGGRYAEGPRGNTVGKNSETVMETGLDNLTKNEAPALIHFGADRTEQWMTVRIQQPSEQDQAPQNEAPQDE